MKTHLTSLLTLSLALTLSACGSHMNDPDIKKNPHAVMRYDVTVTIDGAPGPFDSVAGFMQYEVTNKACVPETGGPMNAMRLAPMANPPIVFTKIADNVYKGTVYADYFQDEDYFGLGVCHWSLMYVTAELKINKRIFVARMPPEQLFAQKSVPNYFVRASYMDNEKENNVFGELDPSIFPPDRQKSIFTIALIAEEYAQ